MTERLIPTIDLGILDGETQAAHQAAAALIDGLSTFGLVYVSGHGIEASVLEDFYSEFIDFTAQPDAYKRALGGEDIWHQRGWTPPSTEKAVVAGGQPDFKECYFAAPMPLDAACINEYPEIFAPNVWPEGRPAFEARYMAMGQALHGVGSTLLEGVERGLDLAQGELLDRLKGGSHVTRALRYLPLNTEQIEQKVVWGEEHTDFNLLTILPGGRFYDPQGAQCASPDASAGLYLRSRPTAENPAGERVRGTPPPGCIVVQVGQQLEILTGGRLLATPHVITAPKFEGYTRCSMAHFIHLHPLQLLRPLAQFATSEARAAYRPSVLAGTYSLKTLVDIGLAPRAALAQLGYRHYNRLAAQRAND